MSTVVRMGMASVDDMPAEFDTACTFARLLNVLDPLDYTPPDSERADQMSNAIIAAPEKLVVSYCGITQCECTQQNPRNSAKPHVFNALFLSGPCGPLATNRKLGTLGWQ